MNGNRSDEILGFEKQKKPGKISNWDWIGTLCDTKVKTNI